MPFAVARTRDEAYLYLDLHPCEDCGSVDTAWDSALVDVGGELANRYAGTCASCGRPREYLFGLPERETVPVGFPTFGGPEPSQLVDAGQWLWVADLSAEGAAAEDPEEARGTLAIAIAAVEEILKFMGAEAERVPERAFWSEIGRRVRDQDPARFTRARLVELREDLSRRAAGAGTARERGVG
ncbi:hypothetical protein GCM10023196_107310 [Actinoallomurus vinaceus]|uniref:Uncharacterized protein n=1 Tax=Actinoallomurus vinaceus TaxID=1080074 RepID=A0ABP8UVR1_9ACTN